VELNHYHKTTGAALFDWQKDEKLLKQGPFELRILEEPLPDAITKLYQPLKELLQKICTSNEEIMQLRQAAVDKAHQQQMQQQQPKMGFFASLFHSKKK